MPKAATDIIAFDVNSVERNRELGYPDLDDQRKAFCIEYVSNGYRHIDAAVRVGFAKVMGSRLKREPLIAAYINDLMDKYLAESIVTKTTLDSYLDELEEIAMGRVDVPMVTGSGESFHARKFHPDLAMKVYAERSKLHGIVEDDPKIAPVNVTINMAGMTGPAPTADDGGVVIEHETR